MQLSSFPSCCGASIITGFTSYPGTKVTVGTYDPVTRTYPQVIAAEKLRQLVQNAHKAYRGRVLLQCVLNKTQVGYGWVPYLKHLGFKHKSTWINGVHNSTLYLFELVLYDGKPANGRLTDAPTGWNETPTKAIEAYAKIDEDNAKREACKLKDPFNRTPDQKVGHGAFL